MAALIRQANKRVRNGQSNKPEIKTKKKERMVEKKRKRERNKKHFLKRKRRQEMSASNETKAGYT